MDTIKLQKHLAELGLGSRREIETWITAGRISVNGETAHIGQRVNLSDHIKLDGKLLQANAAPNAEQTRVLLYHKPIGKVCTRQDEKGRATVFEDLPSLKYGRWIMIGRLDLNTSGLLLFTNNGELANKLMHPSSELEREYAVRIHGKVSDEILHKLKEGVMLEDGMAKFKSIRPTGGDTSHSWFHVVLTRGRNREVRRLWESQGVQVSRLMRVRFATINLPKDLKPGKLLTLSASETQKLLAI